MRKALSICAVALVLFNAQAWATWSLSQTTVFNSTTCGTGASTCTIPVTSTGSGHVIFIGLTSTIASQTISSVSGGGTYTHPSSCAGSEAGTARSSDCAYTLSSTSGTTSIVVTRSATTIGAWKVCAAEVQSSVGVGSIDPAFPNGTSVSSTSATTSAVGPALNPTGNNPLNFQILSGGTPTAINQSYVGTFSTSAGCATLINSAPTGGPTWTQGSQDYSASGISVDESSSVAAVPKLTLLGVGP